MKTSASWLGIDPGEESNNKIGLSGSYIKGEERAYNADEKKTNYCQLEGVSRTTATLEDFRELFVIALRAI